MNKITFWGDLVARDIEGLHLEKEVTNIVSDSEYNIINFEAPVRSPYPPIFKYGPNITQSRQSPAWCFSHGFNIISFANNHTLDFGEKAMIETMNMFPSDSVMGAGTWEEAYKPKILTLTNGKHIGIISGTHREFGVLYDEMVQKGERGSAWLFHHRIIECILETRKYVDYLYIYAHGGVEFMVQPLPEWRNAFKHFVNLGCDGVICSHPHIPMGWEFYNGKPIIYSLGNFCFQKQDVHEIDLPQNWNNSLCCQISFCNEEPQFDLIPIEYNIENKQISKSINVEYLKYLTETNINLRDETLYLRKLEEFITDTSPVYLRMLGICQRNEALYRVKSTIKKILGIDYKRNELIRTLNAVQCESHRWVINRLLDQITKQ